MHKPAKFSSYIVVLFQHYSDAFSTIGIGLLDERLDKPTRSEQDTKTLLVEDPKMNTRQPFSLSLHTYPLKQTTSEQRRHPPGRRTRRSPTSNRLAREVDPLNRSIIHVQCSPPPTVSDEHGFPEEERARWRTRLTRRSDAAGTSFELDVARNRTGVRPISA
jgi:hypothetical protein